MEKRIVTTESERNSSIELLRIIATAGVILLHYNNPNIGGGFKYAANGSVNRYYLYAVESLCICSVDLFVMISAYFLCTTRQRKLIRMLELFIQLIAVQVLGYLSEVATGAVCFSVRALVIALVPANYYVVFYAVLYVLSPYINLLIDNLGMRRYKKLLLILLLFFSVWITLKDLLGNLLLSNLYGLSTVSYYGSQEGFTIVNFFLMYCVGAYIRLSQIKVQPVKLILTLLLTFLAIFGISIVESVHGIEDISVWHYYDPLVILFAASLLLLASQMTFYSKAVNMAAKASFSCYLLHPYVIWRLGIRYAVGRSVPIIMIHQLMTVALLYPASFCFYYLYSFATGWLIGKITPAVNNVNISLE